MRFDWKFWKQQHLKLYFYLYITVLVKQRDYEGLQFYRESVSAATPIKQELVYIN